MKLLSSLFLCRLLAPTESIEFISTDCPTVSQVHISILPYNRRHLLMFLGFCLLLANTCQHQHMVSESLLQLTSPAASNGAIYSSPTSGQTLTSFAPGLANASISPSCYQITVVLSPVATAVRDETEKSKFAIDTSIIVSSKTLSTTHL